MEPPQLGQWEPYFYIVVSLITLVGHLYIAHVHAPKRAVKEIKKWLDAEAVPMLLDKVGERAKAAWEGAVGGMMSGAQKALNNMTDEKLKEAAAKNPLLAFALSTKTGKKWLNNPFVMSFLSPSEGKASNTDLTIEQHISGKS